MPSETTNGAISGAASGASAGAYAGPWGAVIGGVAGGVIGGIGGAARGRAMRRAAILRGRREAAERQIAGFETQANADATERLRQLAAQRYASYGTLSGQLGGAERAAAGEKAGMDFESRQGAALGGVDMAPVGNRALVGGAASDSAVNDQLAPLLAARVAALRQNRVQTGLQDYDTGAFNQAQNTSLDISRQAQEEGQRQALLAAARQRMLAQIGAQYADRGPTNGENNQMLLSQLGLAGMQVAGGLYGQSRQNALADAARRRSATPAFNPNIDYSGASNPFGYNPPSYTYTVN